MIFPDMVIMPFLVALISLKIEKVTQIVPVILPIIQILLAWSFSKIAWNTSVGINWTKICDSVPWGDRMTQMMCSFNGKCG